MNSDRNGSFLSLSLSLSLSFFLSFFLFFFTFTLHFAVVLGQTCCFILHFASGYLKSRQFQQFQQFIELGLLLLMMFPQAYSFFFFSYFPFLFCCVLLLIFPQVGIQQRLILIERFEFVY